MCVHKQNTSTDRSLSSSHFSVKLQRPPKYLQKQKYGFFCLKLYNWYMCLAAEWTGSHHQTHVVCDGMERGLRCSHFTQQRVMDVGGNCDVMSGQENPLTCLVSSLNRPNCGSPEMMYLKILRPEFLLTIITQHTYTALI